MRNLLSLNSGSALLVVILLFAGRFDLLSGPPTAQPRLADFLTNSFFEVRWWALVLLGMATIADLGVRGSLVQFDTRSTRAFYVCLGFMALLILSVAKTHGSLDTITKAIDVLHLLAATVLVYYWVVVGQSEWAMRVLFLATAVGGVACGVALATIDLSDRASIAGGGPNTFVRIAGVTGIACLAIKEIALPFRLLFMLLASLLVLATQSRGGALAFAVSVAAFLVWNRFWVSRVLVVICLAVVAVGGLSQTEIGQQYSDNIYQRFYQKTYVDGSSAGRDRIYQHSWEIWKGDFIFGRGLNAWKSEVDTYPHNIFLEAGCDVGMVGALMLICFCILVARSAIGCRSEIGRAMFCLSLFYLVAAQFSGDVFDSRGFFFLSIMAVVLAQSGPSLVEGVQPPELLNR